MCNVWSMRYQQNSSSADTIFLTVEEKLGNKYLMNIKTKSPVVMYVACRYDSGCKRDCKTFARAWCSLEGQAKKRTWRMLTDLCSSTGCPGCYSRTAIYEKRSAYYVVECYRSTEFLPLFSSSSDLYRTDDRLDFSKSEICQLANSWLFLLWCNKRKNQTSN